MAAASAAILGLAVGVVGFALTTKKEHGSGIRGRVTGGCIVERCSVYPRVGVQQVFRRSGGPEGPLTFVTEFRSSPDGSFVVRLQPGRYLIDFAPKSPAPGFMKAEEVIVRKDQFATVSLFYDVGMR